MNALESFLLLTVKDQNKYAFLVYIGPSVTSMSCCPNKVPTTRANFLELEQHSSRGPERCRKSHGKVPLAQQSDSAQNVVTPISMASASKKGNRIAKCNPLFPAC